MDRGIGPGWPTRFACVSPLGGKLLGTPFADPALYSYKDSQGALYRRDRADPSQECPQHCLGGDDRCRCAEEIRAWSPAPCSRCRNLNYNCLNIAMQTTWAEPVWTDKEVLRPWGVGGGGSELLGHLTLSWGSEVCHLLPEFLHSSSPEQPDPRHT